jgi:uncharacterized protein YunC (DUF1805 family)
VNGHGGEVTSSEMTVEGRGIRVSVVPLGQANLVLAQTTSTGGVLACGAVDPSPLEKFGVPAARVRPTRGPSVVHAEDLLTGLVTEANGPATALGVRPGMSGREAITLL